MPKAGRDRPGFDPWVGKISWRKAWKPTPVFLPRESPRTEEPGHKELDMTQHSTEETRKDAPLQAAEGAGPCQHLDLELLVSRIVRQ